MISLTCTKCGSTLTVDDGFAGGVCRCNRCGTIQTVPKLGQLNGENEAIFERSRVAAAQRELEALGDVVTSSGLMGSGMLRQSQRANVPDQRKRHGALIATLAGAAVAVGIGCWMVVRHAGNDESPPDQGSAPATPAIASDSSTPAATPAPHPVGPAFGPISLVGTGTVVYLVDRGDATRAFTAPLARAVAMSASTLGATRKFQVIFWSADGESPAFPTTPSEATPSNLSRLATWITDVPGGRATDASTSLDAALAVKPSRILILTGKAWQLDDSFANEAIIKLASRGVRIDAIALGGSAGSDALARVTAKTGGSVIEMNETTLEELGR